MPVKLKSTRLKFLFFGLLLLAFACIQYSWVKSLQKDKLQQFKSQMFAAIESAASKASLHELADTAIANIFRKSFSTKGLGNVKFEYALALHDKQVASAGFDQKQSHGASNLVLHYVLRHTGEKQHENEMVTILVPFWKKIALKEMSWIIVASVLLTLMICAIFYSVSYFCKKEQTARYDNRTNLVRNMMQQLESPLSTMSVAAEALRNAKVMHDERKVNYYQQIITEESHRMNEQVEKFLREIK
jgi:K+-sensing histidine kinase KdpD